MHDHDLDLIAALADGSLDDQSEARALVETCPECHLEYETQLSIVVALAAIAPVAMTDLEKAALHRDLWTELRSQPAGRATATPWWYRLSYAAAGLFVLVGLVAVLGQLGASDEVSETFSEVSSSLDEGTDGQIASPLAEEEGGEYAGTTTAAADSAEGGAPDYKTLADETRAQQLPAANRATGTDEDEAACLTAAGLQNQEVVGLVEADRKYLIAVANDEDLDADTPVNFVDATTCEVAHVEE